MLYIEYIWNISKWFFNSWEVLNEIKILLSTGLVQFFWILNYYYRSKGDISFDLNSVVSFFFQVMRLGREISMKWDFYFCLSAHLKFLGTVVSLFWKYIGEPGGNMENMFLCPSDLFLCLCSSIFVRKTFLPIY